MSTSLQLRLLLAMLTLASPCGAADPPQGMWKSYVPEPGTLHGEFDNHDPVGLAAGAEIKADCSLRWVDEAANKMYCFSSGTSLAMFLEEPSSYLARARKSWDKLHPADHGVATQEP
jgi:hypothetical protein